MRLVFGKKIKGGWPPGIIDVELSLAGQIETSYILRFVSIGRGFATHNRSFDFYIPKHATLELTETYIDVQDWVLCGRRWAESFKEEEHE